MGRWPLNLPFQMVKLARKVAKTALRQEVETIREGGAAQIQKRRHDVCVQGAFRVRDRRQCGYGPARSIRRRSRRQIARRVALCTKIGDLIEDAGQGPDLLSA